MRGRLPVAAAGGGASDATAHQQDAGNAPRARRRCARCGGSFRAVTCQRYCLGCRREVRQEQARSCAKRYVASHRRVVHARRVLYYAKNVEREHAKHREWLARNKDRVRAAAAAYRARHPEKVRTWKAVSYQRNRERILARNRAYNRRNREQLKNKARTRYWGNRDPIRDRKRPGPEKVRPRPPFGFATSEQLRLCLEDPRRSWEICGPGVIVCLECSGKFSTLSRHLQFHGMTARDYKRKPGTRPGIPRLNASASLMSVALQGLRRKTSKRLGLGWPKKGLGWPLAGRNAGVPRPPASLESRLDRRDAMLRALARKRRGTGRRQAGRRAGPGRPATERTLFAEAKRLHEQEGLSWRRIAKQLRPTEFEKNQHNAAETLRKGAKRLKRPAQP
jgi:ROS/MUCR transcriptional regulator protein